ncbi:MAG TPA: taurine ABC transporter permease [Advenella kashmirensis]|uniref:Thiamine pyrimidine synthase n=1 Tax=Advenella kashmirensis TaxID=310575 RepID=A0A356LI92_9BURK|nr:taurine ABC transporter permease [Advenella kashmirensis]
MAFQALEVFAEKSLRMPSKPIGFVHGLKVWAFRQSSRVDRAIANRSCAYDLIGRRTYNLSLRCSTIVKPNFLSPIHSLLNNFIMKTSTTRFPLTRLCRSYLLAVMTLAVVSGHASAQSPTKIRFAADWAFQGPQAPFLLPHENGCYAKAGLDVTTDRGFGSGDTVSKVASGSYDVGFADINAMIEYNARQPAAKLISFFMIYDGAALSIVTRKNTGIAKPADLVGKTIAAPAGDASRRLFPVLAKANGFDADQVKWVNVSPELRESMLVRKNADAISGASFTAYIGVHAGGLPKDDIVVLRYPQFGASLYGSALVVKPAFAAANENALKSMVACIAQGMSQSIRQPEVAIDALTKREKLTDRVVEKERMQLSLDWSVNTPWVKQHGMSSIDPARMEQSLKDVAAALNIPVPPASEVYTDKYLPERSSLILTK